MKPRYLAILAAVLIGGTVSPLSAQFVRGHYYPTHTQVGMHSPYGQPVQYGHPHGRPVVQYGQHGQPVMRTVPSQGVYVDPAFHHGTVVPANEPWYNVPGIQYGSQVVEYQRFVPGTVQNVVERNVRPVRPVRPAVRRHAVRQKPLAKQATKATKSAVTKAANPATPFVKPSQSQPSTFAKQADSKVSKPLTKKPVVKRPEELPVANSEPSEILADELAEVDGQLESTSFESKVGLSHSLESTETLDELAQEEEVMQEEFLQNESVSSGFEDTDFEETDFEETEFIVADFEAAALSQAASVVPTARNRKAKSNRWWLAPLLAIPLLCWYVRRIFFFRARKKTAVRERSEIALDRALERERDYGKGQDIPQRPEQVSQCESEYETNAGASDNLIPGADEYAIDEQQSYEQQSYEQQSHEQQFALAATSTAMPATSPAPVHEPAQDAGLSGHMSDSLDLADATDDFSRLVGISEETRQSLYQLGYRTFRDLEAADPVGLQHRLAAMGLIFADTDIQQWSHQASLAARDKQGPVSESPSNLAGEFTGRSTADDLTLIHGVGPATEALFHEQGIFRLEQIAALNSDQLIAMLGSKATFESLDAESWPRQANEFVQVFGSVVDTTNFISQA